MSDELREVIALLFVIVVFVVVFVVAALVLGLPLHRVAY
jgi:hypothetical protein